MFFWCPGAGARLLSDPFLSLHQLRFLRLVFKSLSQTERYRDLAIDINGSFLALLV